MNPICSQLISEATIARNLPSIFSDVIVFDTRFDIVNISPMVLTILGYGHDELVGQNIDVLAPGANLKAECENALQGGFFTEKELEFQTRQNQRVIVGVSGFYMGLISDMNGYILLRIKNLNEVKKIYERLEEKSIELDYFLYRTAHDLRGPLASIMGLTYIASLDSTETERKHYFDKISQLAEQLDNSLRNIYLIANSGLNDFDYLGSFSLEKIEGVLRNIVQTHAGENRIDFHFYADNLNLSYLNEIYVLALLKNLLITVFEFRKVSPTPVISFEITNISNSTRIVLQAKGFEVPAYIVSKINSDHFSCAEGLKDNLLARFYAIQKVVHKLHGNMQIITTGDAPKAVIQLPGGE